MTHDSPPLYVFLHIPKTAGTALAFHVRRAFHPRHYLLLYKQFLPGCGTRDGLFNFIDGLSPARRQSLRFLIGHRAFYGVHQFFDREVRYVTAIRDVPSWLLSEYNFARTNFRRDGVTSRKVILGPTGSIVSFEEFFTQEVEANSLVRYLVDRGFCDEAVLTDLQNGHAAIADALSKFYFIGLHERWNEDFWILNTLFGVRPQYSMSFNVSTKYVAPEAAESFRAAIESRNSMDVYLHRLVVRRNEEFKASQPSVVAAARALRQRVQRNAWYWLPVVALYGLSEVMMRRFNWYAQLIKFQDRALARYFHRK